MDTLNLYQGIPKTPTSYEISIVIWYGDPESTGRVTLGIPAGLLSRQLPACLALGRGTLGTRNKLVRKMNGAEPAVRGS